MMNDELHIEPMNLAEILALPEETTKRRWGRWHLLIRNWTLVYIEDSGYRRQLYEIDLEKINTCGQMLDWIFQLNHRRGMTAQDKADLLQAFYCIFHPQQNSVRLGALSRSMRRASCAIDTAVQ
jgi:hypothetical protein